MSVHDAKLLSNEEVARYVAAGQVDLWPELAERVVKLAHPIVTRGVPPADYEDEIQNVVIRVWKSLTTYDSRRPLIAWVAVIARRELIDYYRLRKRQVDIERIDWLADAVAESGEAPLTAADILNWMAERLGSTTDAQAVCWHVLAGYTYSEIGTKLAKSADAAKMQAHRALRDLRRGLSS